MKKLIITLLLTIFCQKSFSKIISVNILANPITKKKILFLGDYHQEYGLSIGELQFNVLDNWLNKLTKKTKFIFEGNEPVYKRIPEKFGEHYDLLIWSGLFFRILIRAQDKSNYPQFTNNVTFVPSDIRDYPEFIAFSDPCLALEIKIDNADEPKDRISILESLVDNSERTSLCRNILLNRATKNELEKLHIRNQKLHDSVAKKKFEEAIAKFQKQTKQWDDESYDAMMKVNVTNHSNCEIQQPIIKKISTYGDQLAHINFADLGFILSILETLEESEYENIIVYTGFLHTKNILKFFTTQLGYINKHSEGYAIENFETFDDNKAKIDLFFTRINEEALIHSLNQYCSTDNVVTAALPLTSTSIIPKYQSIIESKKRVLHQEVPSASSNPSASSDCAASSSSAKSDSAQVIQCQLQ